MIRKGQLVGVAKGDILAQNRVIAQMFGIVAHVVLYMTLYSHLFSFPQGEGIWE
jgi:hypothetical protein